MRLGLRKFQSRVGRFGKAVLLGVCCLYGLLVLGVRARILERVDLLSHQIERKQADIVRAPSQYVQNATKKRGLFWKINALLGVLGIDGQPYFYSLNQSGGRANMVFGVYLNFQTLQLFVHKISMFDSGFELAKLTIEKSDMDYAGDQVLAVKMWVNQHGVGK